MSKKAIEECVRKSLEKFFRDLDCCAGLTYTRAVNHQEIACRTVGRQNTTQELLMTLKLILRPRIVTESSAQLLPSIQRRSR